ncbi:MAG: SelB C-terminal domain-containing protein, partial [Chloroflexi bacterium]|nr:SelB C-terminal domain-containing protein [Chloroflexota bacterium]
VLGKLRLLDKDTVEPGDWAWAQLKLDGQLAVVKGDYFVVRGGGDTLGGGNVVDPYPKRHRRMHASTIERLVVMEHGSDREVLLKSIEVSEPAEFGAVVQRANLPPEQAKVELMALATEGLVIPLGHNVMGPGVVLYSVGGWNSLSDKARQTLTAYHSQFPLKKGAPKEEFRSRLGLATPVFNSVLPMLVEQGVLAEDGTSVRLQEHAPKLSVEQERMANGYVDALKKNSYSPPTDSMPPEDVLSVLADSGEIVRVSESVAFSKNAYEDMVSKIRAHITDKGQITVADVRDLFDTSRKYALALMEYLDQQRVTRRVGDARVLR